VRDERLTVELLIMAAYQPSYGQFFNLCMDNLEELTQQGHQCPSLVLFNLAMDHFNCAFGDCRGCCLFNHINLLLLTIKGSILMVMETSIQ
jgi:hypothetical protein